MVTLVLIRHGQSLWNAENKFTGWTDIGLSEKGIKEAENAGKKLEDVGFDVVHTSALIRAQKTAEISRWQNGDLFWKRPFVFHYAECLPLFYQNNDTFILPQSSHVKIKTNFVYFFSSKESLH